MNMATPAIQDFARRLVAVEAARDSSSGARGAAVRVCERLRLPLSKLAGVAGFHSLLSRAVALARAEVPSLAAVQVRADGSLEGLDDPGPDRDAGADGQPGVAIVAQLVGLLVTFIGEPLTLSLVGDAWPGAILTGIGEGSGEGT
jgi:hypothetical protein